MPPILVGLEARSYLVMPEESVTVVAHVSGTSTPVTWTLNCDTGQASIVPTANSATLTAHSGGICFVWAAEGTVADMAVVRIPPLAVGDSCRADSQCGQDAPICGVVSGGCGKSCTLLCMTDADCPISADSGNHVACGPNHLCRLIRNPELFCD